MLLNGYIRHLQVPGAVHNFLKRQRQAGDLTRRVVSSLFRTFLRSSPASSPHAVPVRR
jgi:hypothetical protein